MTGPDLTPEQREALYPFADEVGPVVARMLADERAQIGKDIEEHMHGTGSMHPDDAFQDGLQAALWIVTGVPIG